MFTAPVRIVLIVGAFLVGIAAVVGGQPRPGSLFILGAAVLAIGHFRNGTVWLAHRAETSGQFARATSLLKQIGRPEWLAPQQRAYYNLLRGMASFRAATFHEAEAAFEAAIAGSLRTQNDRALALGMLAASQLELGKREVALSNLRQAKAFSAKPQVSEFLNSVEQQFGLAG